MIQEPCQARVDGWDLKSKVEKNKTLDVVQGHSWGGWETTKEELCQTKDGEQSNLQERECLYCGMIQQRRVRI